MMDIKRGIDRLLETDNVDIMHLLLNEGCIDTAFVTLRAKDVYNTVDKIHSVSTIKLLYENDMIDTELSQIVLELLLRSNRDIGMIKKMMDLGAVMPVEDLAKLPYDDMVEQIMTRDIKIDADIEIGCIRWGDVTDSDWKEVMPKLDWIREHSSEDETVILRILVNSRLWISDNMINYYFDKVKHDSTLADNVIMALIYSNLAGKYDFRGHIIAEELSFFIVIFLEVHAVIDASLKKTLLEIIHPNVKKYVGSDVHKDQDRMEIWRVRYGTFEEFCEYITDNSRMLLDIAEMTYYK